MSPVQRKGFNPGQNGSQVLHLQAMVSCGSEIVAGMPGAATTLGHSLLAALCCFSGA